MKLLSYALVFAVLIQDAIMGLVLLAAFRDLSESAVKRLAVALIVLVGVQGAMIGVAALRALAIADAGVVSAGKSGDPANP